MHPNPEVVAHRGASALAPEHTFAAYDLALRTGADTLELDIRATRDAELVVIHDPTLTRTTGDPRAIADVDAADLAGPRRPLGLHEVLERYGRETRWLLELKDSTPAMEAALIGAVRAHGLAELTTVQSFQAIALHRVRSAAPDIEVAPLLCESLDSERVIAGVRGASAYCSAVGVFHGAIDRRVMQTARAAGIRLRAYTVNAPAEMDRLLALGVAGLITDVPATARELVDSRLRVAVAA